MAEPLDKLILVLELDAAKFKEGMEQIKAELKSLEGGLKELQQVSAQATAELNKIGKAVTAKAGVKQMKEVSQSVAALVTKLKSAKKGSDDLGESMKKITPPKPPKAVSGEEGGGFDLAGLGKMLGVAGLVAGIAVKVFAEMRRLIRELNETIGIPAMISWVKELGGELNELYRTASGMGKKVIPSELWVWGKTAERFGSTSKAFLGSLRNIQAQIGKLEMEDTAEGIKFRGAKTIRQLLGAMKVPEELVKGKDALTILQTFAENMRNMTAREQATFGKMMGIDRETMEMLKQARQYLPEILGYYRKLAPDQATITRLSRSADAFKQLEHNIEVAKMTLVAELAPALTEVTNLLGRITQWIKENPEEARNVFYAIAISVTALTAALMIFTVVAGALLAVILLPMVATLWQAVSAMRILGDETTSLGDKLYKLANLTPLGAIINYARLKGEVSDLETEQDVLDQKRVDMAREHYRRTTGSLSNPRPGAASGTVNTDVSVGQVVVNTRATDAQGIAKEIPQALQGSLGGYNPLNAYNAIMGKF